MIAFINLFLACLFTTGVAQGSVSVTLPGIYANANLIEGTVLEVRQNFTIH
jgi:hypothetical protein